MPWGNVLCKISRWRKVKRRQNNDRDMGAIAPACTVAAFFVLQMRVKITIKLQKPTIYNYSTKRSSPDGNVIKQKTARPRTTIASEIRKYLASRPRVQTEIEVNYLFWVGVRLKENSLVIGSQRATPETLRHLIRMMRSCGLSTTKTWTKPMLKTKK